MKRYNILARVLGVLLALSWHTASADMEEWYTYWGLGFAGHTYEEPLDSDIQFLDSLPGVTRTEIALDMLGFYWPLSQQTIAGVVVSGSSDRLSDDWDYLQYNQYLYAGSVMHFFGKEVGDGFFLRGDLGFAKASLSSSLGISGSSDTGSGLLLGVGYAVPVSPGFRLLFSLTSSSNNIEGDRYGTTALRIGGLW